MQVRSEEIISVTDLQRQDKDIFTQLADGIHDKFVVMRNDELAAVMLTVEHYQALVDEVEDLRIEAIARERMANFDPAQAVSHEEMLARFAVDE